MLASRFLIRVMRPPPSSLPSHALVSLAPAWLLAALAWSVTQPPSTETHGASADESGGARAPVQTQPLGPGPQWRGPIRPHAANEVFATGNGCSMCHAASDSASAMRTRMGDDASPHGLWQATLMANSARDPFWRASVAREVAARPEEAAATEADCLRCHAPMAHHTARLGGLPPPRMAQALSDPLALDGVSCTVCHKIESEGLGQEASFGGNAMIARTRAIYGPYKDPAEGPMQMHSGYEPQQGMHIRSSALCATCHTSTAQHLGQHAGFREQTPYLEWRNSDFSTETPEAATPASCQDCHMAEVGATRIARNPMGRDFLIEPRELRAHAFVGGNAFMLEMLAKHREELGVSAPEAALKRMAQATRSQLAERTAELSVLHLRREDSNLAFDVEVRNLSGHKLPTGYPARRVWLEVQVRVENQLVFHGGKSDAEGRILGLGNELEQPHRELVIEPTQVPIYEFVADDSDGKATTELGAMRSKRKDTRLLPRGWKPDGPHAADTAPVGIGADPDFRAGSDTVSYRIPLPADPRGSIRVLAYLRYQAIPPAWVDPLRKLKAFDATQFVGYYDAAEGTIETITIGQAFLD